MGRRLKAAVVAAASDRVCQHLDLAQMPDRGRAALDNIAQSMMVRAVARSRLPQLAAQTVHSWPIEGIGASRFVSSIRGFHRLASDAKILCNNRTDMIVWHDRCIN